MIESKAESRKPKAESGKRVCDRAASVLAQRGAGIFSFFPHAGAGALTVTLGEKSGVGGRAGSGEVQRSYELMVLHGRSDVANYLFPHAHVSETNMRKKGCGIGGGSQGPAANGSRIDANADC